MVDPLHDPLGLPQPLQRVRPGTDAPGTPAERPAAGAEFQALLERIETRARELARTTDDVHAPDQLAGAVDSARTSLEEVHDLKERRLEAYHQQQRQGGQRDVEPGAGGAAQ
jgi:hypothetical protein